MVPNRFMQKLVILIFTVFTFSEFNPFGPGLTDSYIQEYSSIAISEMERTGIPASIKLAQGLLESNWGRSDLAKNANNHFGIKCGASWKGERYFKEDDDYHNGQLIASCFRAYTSPKESYEAHSNFLRSPRKSGRYDFLFAYPSTDYISWAKGLQKAGYATDPMYPGKLIRIIEKYQLYKYDKAPKEIETTKPSYSDNRTIIAVEPNAIVETRANDVEHFQDRIEQINSISMVRAREGESPLAIALLFGVSFEDLKSFNERLPDKNEVLKAGEIVFLGKKKRSFEGAKKVHEVQHGETMYMIAQQYGLRLSSLNAKNRMPGSAIPLAGEKIYLKRKVPATKRPKFTTSRSLKSKKKYLFEEG